MGDKRSTLQKKRSTLVKETDGEGIFNQFFANPTFNANAPANPNGQPQDYNQQQPGYYDEKKKPEETAIPVDEAGGMYDNMGAQNIEEEDAPDDGMDSDLKAQFQQSQQEHAGGKDMYAEYTPMPQKWTPLGDATAFVNRDKDNKKISTTKLLLIIVACLAVVGVGAGLAAKFAAGGSSSTSSTSAPAVTSGNQLPCDPGYALVNNTVNGTSTLNCTACPIGQFSLGKVCLGCVATRNTSSIASPAFSSCLCVPGTEHTTGTDFTQGCSSCSGNTIKANLSNTEPCVACPSGKTASNGFTICV